MVLLGVTTEKVHVVLILVLLRHGFEPVKFLANSEVFVLDSLPKFGRRDAADFIPVHEPRLLAQPADVGLLGELVIETPRLAGFLCVGDDAVRRLLEALVHDAFRHPSDVVHDELQVVVLDAGYSVCNDFNSKTPNQNVLTCGELDDAGCTGVDVTPEMT